MIQDKPQSRKVKYEVISFDKRRRVIVYKKNGKLFQHTMPNYDGKSKYIELCGE